MKYIWKKYFKIDYKCDNVFTHFNIKKLKEDNIESIVFDLDNTLCTNLERKASKEQIEFLKSIKKEFNFIICSNNTQSRVEEYISSLPFEVNGYSWCKKPFKFKIKKILKINGFDKSKTLFVGDQLITDIIVSNRLKSKICFVKPLHKKELGLTKFNRNFERYILKKVSKHNLVTNKGRW